MDSKKQNQQNDEPEFTAEFLALDDNAAMSVGKPETPKIEKEIDQEVLFSSDDELEQFLDGDTSKKTVAMPKVKPAATSPAKAAAKKTIEAPAKAPRKQTIAPNKPPREKAASIAKQPPIDCSEFLTEASRNGGIKQFDAHSKTAAKQLHSFPKGINGIVTIATVDKECSVEFLDIKVESTPATLDAPSIEPDSDVHSGGKENIYHDLRRKAKAQLNCNKEQLDIYFGRNLPQRTFALDFNFLSYKNKKAIDNPPNLTEVNKTVSGKGASRESLMTSAEHDLATLIRSKLSPSKRLKFLDLYLPTIISSAKLQIATFVRKPSMAGEPLRIKATANLRNTLRYAINGYKQAYKELYELPNHLYGPRRELANDVAFTLFDLLCLEQKLLRALHSPANGNATKTINKLFHALSRYEPQLLDTPKDSRVLAEKSTIENLFLDYQIVESLDLSQVSPQLHPALYDYLHSHRRLLQILPVDKPLRFTGQAWVIPHNLSSAPLFAENSAALPAVADGLSPYVIFVQRFFNQIKNDYARCIELLGQEKPVHGTYTLSKLSLQESISMMGMLNQSVKLIESRKCAPTFSVYQPVSLEAYSGLNDCVQYYAHDYAQSILSNGPKSAAAKVTEKRPKSYRGEWQRAMENDECLWLQTNETRATIDISVGQAMLIARSVDDRKEVLLVRVQKIERISPEKMTVVTEKLGYRSTNISVMTPEGETLQGLVTLLGEGKKAEHFLLVPAQGYFYSGQNLCATMVDGSQSIMQVEALKSVSPSLQLLKLH